MKVAKSYIILPQAAQSPTEGIEGDTLSRPLPELPAAASVLCRVKSTRYEQSSRTTSSNTFLVGESVPLNNFKKSGVQGGRHVDFPLVAISREEPDCDSFDASENLNSAIALCRP